MKTMTKDQADEIIEMLKAVTDHMAIITSRLLRDEDDLEQWTFVPSRDGYLAVPTSLASPPGKLHADNLQVALDFMKDRETFNYRCGNGEMIAFKERDVQFVRGGSLVKGEDAIKAGLI